jgi:SAM-dependent methyltransferase
MDAPGIVLAWGIDPAHTQGVIVSAMHQAHGGSASIAIPTYWWYRARTDLLKEVLQDFVEPGARTLDVGSADGPSVAWLRDSDRHVSLDLDPRGLGANGICGSALALPFEDAAFDIVAAFDVIEHCHPEKVALDEIARVLAPGGRLLMSVPAYQWAWSDFDEQNGHHRRYTRTRAVQAVERSGFAVDRATYAFTSVFPFFVAERVARRARPSSSDTADIVSLPTVPPMIDSMLMGLSRVDGALLRRTNLPFGSSVVLAASKPQAS